MAVTGATTINQISLLEIDQNPYVGGLSAPIGSIASLNSGSGLFYKTGADDYDWAPATQGSRSSYIYISDDFLGSNVSSVLGWKSVVSGAGASAVSSTTGIDATSLAAGVVSLSTGTTSTGRSTVGLGLDQILLSSTQLIVLEFRINIASLSTAGQEFTQRFGLFDQSGAGDAIDGVYFEYDRLNSVNWTRCSSSNSTRTKTATTVAVATGYNTFRIIIQPQIPTAKFFINDVDVGDLTTNLPTGAGRNTGIAMKIQKSAGTTSVLSHCDYFRCFIDVGARP